jgi:hypothetical protein
MLLMSKIVVYGSTAVLVLLVTSSRKSDQRLAAKGFSTPCQSG